MLWLIKGLDVKTVAHAMLVQIVNLSARLVPFITCPVYPVSSIVNLFYDLDCLRLVRLKIFSPFWPLCMTDPMLFCVSALSCVTKLVKALILMGQENLLVMVPELRWVGFWSLTSLVCCPQFLVLIVDIPPSFPRSRRLKSEAICLPSLHALWAICYMLSNASLQMKLQTVFLDTNQKGYEMKLLKAQNKAVEKQMLNLKTAGL